MVKATWCDIQDWTVQVCNFHFTLVLAHAHADEARYPDGNHHVERAHSSQELNLASNYLNKLGGCKFLTYRN